jgi:5-methylcytosine-specific restriction protein B
MVAREAAGWGDVVIERAAQRVIETGLGSGRSATDSGEAAWTGPVASDLYRRVIVEEDTGTGAFLSKLEVQLSGADRATHLLCGELLYLHVVPLSNVGADTKRNRIGSVLGWARPQASLPTDLDEALGRTGIFNGGTGFNVQVWKQMGWLLQFVQHWWGRPGGERAEALNDPWAFRDVVASMPEDQPAIRNSLLYLAFPAVFLPMVNQEHKRDVRNAFALLIDGPTGSDPISIDRDLFAIHTRHLQMAREGQKVAYYDEPYRSQWAKAKDEDMRAWLVRSRPAEAGVVAQWRTDGQISLPAAHLPELEPGTGLARIRAMVEESYGHEDYVQRLARTTEFDIFCNRMKIDDIVAVVEGDRRTAGQITGEPQRTRDEDDRFSRSVAWSGAKSAGVNDVSAKLTDALDQPGVIVDLTRGIDALLPLLPGAEPPVSPPPPAGQERVTSLRTATDELADDVHMDPAWLQRLIDLLEDRRQIVLYGPPGTGKTFLARKLAHHLTGGSAVHLVQFHPSYSYEDFFEGYRPAQTESGDVTFRLQPGPMRRLASDARADPGTPHILIIDEINRGNLAKIFGELYFLLEYRDDLIRLQYSPDEPFSLPPNVYVIATMNTADRSIALVDAAMRRRFAFVEMHPADPPVRDVLRRWLRATGRAKDPRARLLDALNAEIGNEERDLQIGPSYLMTKENERDGGLDRIWEHSILPVLEEHYYGRLSREEIRKRFGLASIRAKAAPSTPSGL